MGFFERLQSEISNMDIPNLIIVALLFYVPFHFSKKADSLFLHLLYSFFGLYLILTMSDPRVIYDMKMLVGLGLIIPQLRFLRYFIPQTIETIKMMSVNTYYFFITLYYKILRFLNWLNSIYIFIKTFSSNQRKENTDYEEKYKEYKQEYSYESSNNSEKEQQHNYQEETEQEEQKEEYGEYERFYNDSAYIVLGVSTDDDFSTIKKSYRTLIRIYHPDLNPDNIKLFTEITQNINSAYSKLEKIHK